MTKEKSLITSTVLASTFLPRMTRPSPSSSDMSLLSERSYSVILTAIETSFSITHAFFNLHLPQIHRNCCAFCELDSL